MCVPELALPVGLEVYSLQDHNASPASLGTPAERKAEAGCEESNPNQTAVKELRMVYPLPTVLFGLSPRNPNVLKAQTTEGIFSTGFTIVVSQL